MFAFVFALVMLLLAVTDYRRGRVGRIGAAIWVVIWLGLAVVTMLPGFFEALSQRAQAARLLDLVIVAGMMVFGVAAYVAYAGSERLRYDLEEFVRREAIERSGRRMDERSPGDGRAETESLG